MKKKSKFKVECQNVMGMPTDKVTCRECGEHFTAFGAKTLDKMRAWENAHKCTYLHR